MNSTAELREWCAQQRKFLVAEQDAAKTPDAKLIHVGMLRMLNNVESLLVQAGTKFVNHPLPAAFPRSFDELSAILLDLYDLVEPEEDPGSKGHGLDGNGIPRE